MANTHQKRTHPTAPGEEHTAGAVLPWRSPHRHLITWLGLGAHGRNSRSVVEAARIQPGDRVLDVGCGTGDLTLAAKRAAGVSGAVHGIDASPSGIQLARAQAARAGVEATFDVGLIEHLPFPEASFDIVISRLVLHHLPEDVKRRGITELFRVLRPGGRVYLVDFNPPANPTLVRIATALVGHTTMLHSSIGGYLRCSPRRGSSRWRADPRVRAC